MTTAPNKISFTVEGGGKSYVCERAVTAARVMRQRIEVLGIGSKGDNATYGPGTHPSCTMEDIARLIAWEIIGQKAPQAEEE
jgi:hypothetical protein